MSDSHLPPPGETDEPAAATAAASQALVPRLDPAQIGRIVDVAIADWLTERHDRVAPFVERHFGLRGTLRLHRQAVGLDILRAPVNVTLAVPSLAMVGAGAAARRLGARRLAERLQGKSLFLETRVAREITWLIHTDLLEVPCAQDGRRSARDSLAEKILADPGLAAALHDGLAALGERADDARFRRKLVDLLAAYTGSRVAAVEIATNLTAAGTGAVLAHKFTPGALSLGPVLAGVIANSAAAASFPFGTTLGQVWVGLFPATASLTLTTAVTAGLLTGAAALTAFAGVVTDPVQKSLGLHQRRLHRLIDTLGDNLRGGDQRLVVRDHYIARVLDVIDLVRSASMMAVRP